MPSSSVHGYRKISGGRFGGCQRGSHLRQRPLRRWVRHRGRLTVMPAPQRRAGWCGTSGVSGETRTRPRPRAA